MRHLVTALASLLTLLLATAAPSACALDCLAGIQPYAEHYVAQKMADHIFRVEASDGYKNSVTEDISQVDDKKIRTAVKASGGTIAGKATGAVVLDHNTECALVKRLEKRWFSGSVNECAQTMTLRPASEVNKHTHSTVKSAVSKIARTLKVSKPPDTHDFKYGPGDIDRFLMGLHYPGHGSYSVWFSFTRKAQGEATTKPRQTAKAGQPVCEG